jgi:hypothetical protein
MTKQQKTLAQVVGSRKLNTIDKIKKFLDGKRVTVRTNTSGHNYPIGSTYLVSSMWNISTVDIRGMVGENGYLGNTIRFSELELESSTLEDFKLELKTIEDSLAEFNSEKFLVEEKIKFLEDTKTDQFNAEAFLEYKLRTLFSTADGTIEDKIATALAILK